MGVVREACGGGDIELIQEKERVEVLQPRATDAPTNQGPDAFTLLSGQDHLQFEVLKRHSIKLSFETPFERLAHDVSYLLSLGKDHLQCAVLNWCSVKRDLFKRHSEG